MSFEAENCCLEGKKTDEDELGVLLEVRICNGSPVVRGTLCLCSLPLT